MVAGSHTGYSREKMPGQKALLKRKDIRAIGIRLEPGRVTCMLRMLDLGFHHPPATHLEKWIKELNLTSDHLLHPFFKRLHLTADLMAPIWVFSSKAIAPIHRRIYKK